MTNPLSSNISDFSTLLNLFTDKKVKTTTSGGSSSEQTIFSQEAIDNILRGLMEGTSGGSSGLAAVAGGQKAPGLYNSTTRNMLTNDFVARVTGNVAERSARKVINKEPGVSTVTTDAPLDAKGAALGGGALFLASALKKKGGKGILDELGELLSSFSIGLDGGGLGVSNASSGGGVNAAQGMGASPLDFNLSFARGIQEADVGGMTIADPYVPPAPTPEPVVTPVPPVVTPEPIVPEAPVLVEPPAVVAPAPTPVAPVVTPVAPAPVAPPPVPAFDRAGFANLWSKGKYSTANSMLNTYRSQLATYNQTYGSTYVVDAYGIVSSSAATAPFPITGGSGGGSTPTYSNPTTDNLFQGNLGGVGSGSGDTLTVGL